MPLSALALVLTSGAIHASWNLLSKRSRAGSTFVMLYSGLSCLLYLPLALYFASTTSLALPPKAWLLILASGCIHYVYALTLQRGYQLADLNIVYPTARGSGPLIASTAAVLLLGEPLTPRIALGILLIVAGIFSLTAKKPTAQLDRASLSSGLRYGLLTGCCIAGYTLTDSTIVKQIGLMPFLLDFLSNAIRTVILLPAMITQRQQLAQTYRDHTKAVYAVAILSPLSYIIVLYAMKLAPLTQIAPAREVSTLFGVLGSTLLLGEPFGLGRLLGAALIVLGVFSLAG